MRVETNQYEFSHGRKPRGRGRWFFTIGNDKAQLYGVSGVRYYSEAKKVVSVIAKEVGETFITVQP